MQTIKIAEDHAIVEVFKTTVKDEKTALDIITDLQRMFPNFDLDDCDKILRVESKGGYVEVKQIMEIVRSFKHNIEILL